MVSKKTIGFGAGGVVLAGAAAAFFMVGGQDTPAPAPRTEEGAAATSPAAPAARGETQVPLYVFDDLTVNRPGGQTFTVTAAASCGRLAQDFNLNNATQLAAFEQACRERTERSLNYFACDRENFFPSVPTSNAELRALGLPEDTEVTERHLWTPEQVANAGSRGSNSFTIQEISDVAAAKSTEGYEQIANCGDVIYRGAAPQPKP